MTEVRGSSGWLVQTSTDSKPSMDEEALDRIWTEFYRLSLGARRKKDRWSIFGSRRSQTYNIYVMNFIGHVNNEVAKFLSDQIRDSLNARLQRIGTQSKFVLNRIDDAQFLDRKRSAAANEDAELREIINRTRESVRAMSETFNQISELVRQFKAENDAFFEKRGVEA